MIEVDDVKKRYGTLAVLFLSISLMVVGLLQGQNADVLAKAVKICLECIGIG